MASSYPLLDVFVSTLYLVLFLFWIILVFHIMFDIFRSYDLSAQGHFWIIFMLVFPLPGAWSTSWYVAGQCTSEK